MQKADRRDGSTKTDATLRRLVGDSEIMVQVNAVLDRIGDSRSERELKRRKLRDEAAARIPRLKKRYVEGKDADRVLSWAYSCSHLSGNRYVTDPTKADQDPDLLEVTRVVETLEPHERGLVIYIDARDGQLYSYAYSVQ